MEASGFASGSEETSGQNHPLSRRQFLISLSALLALGSLPESAQAEANFAPFSFAFVSDVHLCTGMGDSLALLQESQLFLQDVVKQLNSLKLDFVIFGGDQVEGPGKDDANWNLFIDVLQTLNAPWYFVLGETDVSGHNTVDKITEYGPDLKGRGLTSGKPYWSLDPVPGVHLVGLDTSRANTTTGDISNEQLGWLKSDLQANRGKFTCVISHHPLLAPPPYDGGPPWDDYMVSQGASAREILGGARDVKLCISGHVPVNKVQKEGNVWYVSGATLAIYPCQFKIFSISPQAVHVETLEISFGALVKKAKKIMEGSRLAYQYSSTNPKSFIKVAEGEEIDCNALLPLVPGAVSPREEKKKVKRPKEKKEEKAEKQEKPGKTNRSGQSDQTDKNSGEGKATEKAQAKSADKSLDKPTEKSSDKSSEKSSDKSSGAGKATDKDKTASPDKPESQPPSSNNEARDWSQMKSEPVNKSSSKSSGKTTSKSSDKAGNKSSDKSGDKSGDKSSDKSGDKSSDKSSDKSGDKSSDKAGGAAGPKGNNAGKSDKSSPAVVPNTVPANAGTGDGTSK